MFSLVERLRKALAPQYEVERELASGGMGTVFLARDPKLDRKVAIKILQPDLVSDTTSERFQREARILAKLSHPNIVPVFAAGDADGLGYYVMEYVEGETLKERLARGSMAKEEALKLANDLLSALEAAHRRGIVHRDVKPGNIFLIGDRALLGDFGIAKQVEDATRDITAAGQQLGTPGYMPPEQAAGEATARTDICATGMVLYEALTGRRWQVLKSSGETDWSGIPSDMAPALRRALAWSPEERWPSASAFRAALLSEPSPAAAGAGKGLKSLLRRFRRGRDAPTTSTSPIQPGMPVESIAVLPFADLSAERDQEYFSDGMTEELIDALAKIEGLRVAARTSSFQFKGQATDVRDVGRKLGVQTVLEGSVRKAGEQLRINAQLIDSHDGFHIWSEKYNRQLADVFAVQEEIARSIVDALSIRLPGGTTGTLVKKPTDDLEAHSLYLKGRHLWNHRDQASLEKSVEYFQKAIERDPNFAHAYSGLADAYLLLGSYGMIERDEAYTKAKAAAKNACELDDTLAEAHTSMGQVLRRERDWEGEEREYRRAIELNPNYATAHQWYATLLAALGRMDEAVREVRRAEELDPLSHAILVTVAIVLDLARDVDGALRQIKKALALEPDFTSAVAYSGWLYAQHGMFDEAFETTNWMAEHFGKEEGGVIAQRASIHALKGETEKARELVEQAIASEADPGLVGFIWTALGDHDRAFEWLNLAIDEDSWFVFHLKVHPSLDPLRSDPRFAALLKKTGLEG